ncbi:hypothetical protein AN403_5967 [Pseudomonas fluorescens]|uniref:Glutathione S-transferase n=1 Tax=Pseudomonas fluorescens TaxID=294 RepID=A0A0P8X772_PSEFL|nr:glutathione S-transferase family protein [Pseudomonas fluorescens]KPU62010.1 hypothetical protein AN403_5967 [Pseudomonas fluorescens]
MIMLYHCLSARSFRPLWALEAMGLKYTLTVLPFPPRVHARHFLDVNPVGTVPAIIIDGVLMTESSGICEYLANKYGPTQLAVLPNEPDYPHYLNWLHYGEATLTFPQTIILRYGQFEDAKRRLPQAVDDYSKWFLGRLRAVDRALEGQKYLCQNRFTMADISVGYSLMLAEFIGLSDEFSSNVSLYWSRLKVQQSYEDALRAQEFAALEQNVPLVHSPSIGREI